MTALSTGIPETGKRAAGMMAAALLCSSVAITPNYSTTPSYFSYGNSMQGISNTSILSIYYDINPAIRMNMQRLEPYQHLLLEMYDHIEAHFPNTSLSIEENLDENGAFDGLYVGIHAKMPVDAAIKALDRLDDAYILPNMERLEGIVVDVVF